MLGEPENPGLMWAYSGKPKDKTSWKLNTFDGSSDCLLDPGIHFLDIMNYMFPNIVVPEIMDKFGVETEEEELEENTISINGRKYEKYVFESNEDARKKLEESLDD